MNRLLIAAIAVIVLAVGVMLLIPRQTETVDIEDRPTPLPEIDTEEVTKIVLEHKVGKRGEDRHKQRVVLTRAAAEGDDDPIWNLEEPVKAKANQSSIKTLLKRLGSFEVSGTASEMASSHEALDVGEEGGISVQVYAGENRLANLVIGKAISGNTMLRLAEQDVVYQTRGSLRYVFGKRAADWRDKSIFSFERDEISHVLFQNDNGTFAFAMEGEGDEADWAIKSVDALAPPPEAEEDDDEPTKAPAKAPAKTAPTERVSTIENFDSARLKSLVGSLARLRCTGFLDDAEGVDTGLAAESAPRVTFKVGAGDSAKAYTVILGAAHDKRSIYTRRTDDEQIFLLTKHLGTRMTPDVQAFQKRKSSGKAPPRPGGMPGMGGIGGPGGNKLPPEIMRQLQQQMMQKQMGGR